jgi:hypothetical protein
LAATARLRRSGLLARRKEERQLDFKNDAKVWQWRKKISPSAKLTVPAQTGVRGTPSCKVRQLLAPFFVSAYACQVVFNFPWHRIRLPEQKLYILFCFQKMLTVCRLRGVSKGGPCLPRQT